ncbi:MAG TPA: hypothetical protein VF163_08255, partial [Micromonosporaceae bacterium]
MIQSVEVSQAEYLTHAQPLPYLTDLAPEPGTDGAWDVDRLAVAVQRRAGRQTDVRWLTDDGARHRDVARTLAGRLHCDVYLTPAGARLRYLKESSPFFGDAWHAIVTDASTSEPLEWTVVRPPGLPDGVPTWFMSSRGRLRQSGGLVTLPLPGGLAFATKATFRDIAELTAQLRAGPDRVTPLTVNVEQGKFEISRFDDAGALLGGAEMATLVAANLDVIHPDVQLAITWPTGDERCKALEAEVIRFANALNRTIWVPEPAGSAVVLAGPGEFAAVDEIGAPSAWRSYGPGGRDHGNHDGLDGLLSTDRDGRLLPAGEIAMTGFGGVPLVSVPPGQLDELREWYESVATPEGLFAIDLAVLGDGRLALCLIDGRFRAVGPRELRALLIAAGWSGEDLLLVAQPAESLWPGLAEHAQQLGEALALDIWLASPGAEVWVRPDGTLECEGPEGAPRPWLVFRYGLPGEHAEAALPPARTGPVHPAEPAAKAGRATREPAIVPATPPWPRREQQPPTRPEVAENGTPAKAGGAAVAGAVTATAGASVAGAAMAAGAATAATASRAVINTSPSVEHRSATDTVPAAAARSASDTVPAAGSPPSITRPPTGDGAALPGVDEPAVPSARAVPAVSPSQMPASEPEAEPSAPDYAEASVVEPERAAVIASPRANLPHGIAWLPA